MKYYKSFILFSLFALAFVHVIQTIWKETLMP